MQKGFCSEFLNWKRVASLCLMWHWGHLRCYRTVCEGWCCRGQVTVDSLAGNKKQASGVTH